MLTIPVEIFAFDIGGTQGRCGWVRCLKSDSNDLHAVRHEPLKIEVFKRDANEDGPRWLSRLLDGAKQIAQEKPRAVAVSFGGPVRPDGTIQSTHVPGWETVDLRGELSQAFGIERTSIHVENDANAGALGEHRAGAGRGCQDMLFFTVSTGIGGGVILDGKLRRGAHGLAGEFGHIIMDASADAPQYAAGKRGALEALACGPSIAREARTALQKLGRAVPPDLSAKDVFDAAAAGEAWAVETRARTVSQLARGIAAVVCAYDVERVVVGGGVSLAGDALFVELRKYVDLFLPGFMEGKVAVVPALLGDMAPLIGAVAGYAEQA